MGTTSEPGVKFKSYQDDWFGESVSVLEMDGKADSLDELIYVESHLCNTGTKYYGELTEQMSANKDAPGSDNGSGLFQTVCAFKIREAFEALGSKRDAGCQRGGGLYQSSGWRRSVVGTTASWHWNEPRADGRMRCCVSA